MTKEEIIQAISDDKMMPFIQSEQLAQIVAFVINNYKPSLPSNLDEAAEEYGRKEYSHAIHFWDEGLSKNKPEVRKEDFVYAFKAGAEWQKAKTLEEAVEGVVCYGSKGAYIKTDFLGEYDTDVYGNSGDKSRVIVIKED